MHAIHQRYTDTGHAADAYHRIDIRGTIRYLVVPQENRVIADITRPTALSEP
jgi:hypothetical protein